MCDVEIVSFCTTTGIKAWKIKRITPDCPFSGWAQEDGSFTAGDDYMLEGLASILFRTPGYAAEWAQEHGWNLAGVPGQ